MIDQSIIYQAYVVHQQLFFCARLCARVKAVKPQNVIINIIGLDEFIFLQRLKDSDICVCVSCVEFITRPSLLLTLRDSCLIGLSCQVSPILNKRDIPCSRFIQQSNVSDSSHIGFDVRESYIKLIRDLHSMLFITEIV